MTLYFLRHAQSMGNLTGDYSTNLHDSLSETGFIQANALSDRLENKFFDKIYCSPLKRAFQTIKPYIKTNDLNVEIWPELAESCWQENRNIIKGDTPKYDEKSFLSEDYLNYFNHRDNKGLVPIENETYSQGISRLLKAIKLIESEANSNDAILIVSHAFTISRLIELLINLPPNGIFDFDNTGISKLIKEKDRYNISYINRI